MINWHTIFLLVLFFSCNQINSDNEKNKSGYNQFDYLPTTTTNAIYYRNGYVFSYSEKHEQAEWVAYKLESNDLGNTNFNRPNFKQDPKVKTQSAHWKNYKKSGYNRGHLCPAADRKKNLELYEETFFTSNIAPQLYEFNGGVWNRLEQKTRYWATKYDGLYVVTGGILKGNLKTIGFEKVAVPNYFYKILMTKDCKKMVGFLLPHEKSKRPLYEFVVSVDEIEKITGIDFFPALEDDLENRLESKNDYKSWGF